MFQQQSPDMGIMGRLVKCCSRVIPSSVCVVTSILLATTTLAFSVRDGL